MPHRRGSIDYNLRKKIIYLDQFVIHDLMKLKNSATKGHATVAADPFWRELHDLLFELRQLQMICCPDSGSHVQESRTSPLTDKKTSDLAGGITFAAFESMNASRSANSLWRGRKAESQRSISGLAASC